VRPGWGFDRGPYGLGDERIFVYLRLDIYAGCGSGFTSQLVTSFHVESMRHLRRGREILIPGFPRGQLKLISRLLKGADIIGKQTKDAIV